MRGGPSVYEFCGGSSIGNEKESPGDYFSTWLGHSATEKRGPLRGEKLQEKKKQLRDFVLKASFPGLGLRFLIEQTAAKTLQNFAKPGGGERRERSKEEN